MEAVGGKKLHCCDYLDLDGALTVFLYEDKRSLKNSVQHFVFVDTAVVNTHGLGRVLCCAPAAAPLWFVLHRIL